MVNIHRYNLTLNTPGLPSDALRMAFVSHGMAFGHLRAATDALPYRKKSASCSWRA